ncbi:egl nine homolog 1 [Melitaea cinxia]|uniref:egl nine homolog 1 n=1 Tax=Melitaea cinxia TaxID=113334 RepID=UPI001E26F409|nr:egl nine homolog 1 [Melitaea cinxia]
MNQEGVLACCAVCNQQTHRRCGRCLNTYYCNTEHQRQDWRRHKTVCAPKLQSSQKNEGIQTFSHKDSESNLEDRKELKIRTSGDSNYKKEILKEGSEVRRLKKSKKKTVKKESSDILNKNKSLTVEKSTVDKTNVKDKSVISSVVYSNKDIVKISAITHEGSSEQEILSENAQQLSGVDFSGASTSSILKEKSETDVKMPVLPSVQPARMKEYPEATLRSNGSPFSSYYMDPSDPNYVVCQRVIRDMTQYGVCVLNNFLGKERGLLVLNEVLEMYRSGIFTAGQLVSNSASTEAQTIRSDRITWIDGKEPHCFHIGQLISQVDNIVLTANKMVNNGKMGNYIINGRTKAMVACYPGSGSHYVKHVDNPNKDGRCITAIYYLNLDWDVKRYGGLLRVFPEGTNQVADIEPIFDRMLFFWSDRRNPHEVQPAYATRYAITLWYFDAQEREEAVKKYKRGQPSSSK